MILVLWWRLQGCAHEYLCLIILAWMALSLPSSWRRGLRGTAVPWVGGEFAIHSAPALLVVKIKQDLFEATETLLLQVRQSIVISHRDLSSLIGKLGNIANLLLCGVHSWHRCM